MRKIFIVAGIALALVFAAAAGAVALKAFRVGVGDQLRVKGSKIVCGVSRNSTIKVAITCFKTNSRGTAVGSYAVQIGDRYAAIMRVKNRKGGTTPIVIKREP